MTHPVQWPNVTDTDSFQLVARSGRHRSEGADAEDWAHDLTATIAEQMRRWRSDRGLSAQQLSDRCTELGYPIQRNVIANIESGRRGTVTIQEVIIIAMALNVPPVILLYPVGSSEVTEIAPGYATSPWSAFNWFTGTRRPYAPMLGGVGSRDETKDAYIEWERAQSIVNAYRAHDRLLNRYRFVRDDTVAELRRMGEPSESRSSRELERRTELLAHDLTKAGSALRRHRRLMAESGIALPPLPSDIDLAAVDDDE